MDKKPYEDQKQENIILTKSYDFALEIVRIFKYLTIAHKEFILIRQVMKSGTSIGANVREAQNAESKIDFIHKLKVAQKEADETLYWLELLRGAEYLSADSYHSLHNQCIDLLKLLKRIVLTAKNNHV